MAEPSTPTGITVREVLGLSALEGAEVLAGAEGLDRLVTRVNVMEVPDLLPWVRPHELLLTTGYPVRAQEDWPGWIADLERHGLAAVAIKFERYVDRLPPEALAEADRLGFPVLRLPDGRGFDDVMNQVLTLVLNRRADTLARAEQVLQDLVGVVIAGGDLDQVCQGVVHHLADTAVVTTMDGRVLAHAGPVPEGGAWASLPGFDPTGRLVVESEVPGVSREEHGSHRLVARIAGSQGELGRLLLLRAEPFTDDDTHVVAQATTAAALAITKSRAVAAVESKYRADFLRDALLGRAGDGERVAGHAADLGWDLRRSLVVVVAEADEPGEGATDVDTDPRSLPERFRSSWEQAATGVDGSAAVAGFSQEVVLLLGVADPDDRDRITARVRAMAEAVHGRGGGGRRTFATGISRTITDLDDLPRAYAEARKAVQVGRRLHGTQSVTHFDALGVFGLLSLIEDDHELSAFVRETLGELADDTPEAEDLRTTLTVLLDHNLNVASTARALHFHYNSMRYRITKLERLLGPFTTDPRLRFALMLALHVRQLDR